MKILPARKLPPKSTSKGRPRNPIYDNVIAAALLRKDGKSIPIECDSQEEAKKVLSALRSRILWKESNLIVRLRGNVVYVQNGGVK